MALSVSIDEASMQWNRGLYVPRAEVHFASALTVAGIFARAFRITVAVACKIEYELPKVEDQIIRHPTNLECLIATPLDLLLHSKISPIGCALHAAWEMAERSAIVEDVAEV